MIKKTATEYSLRDFKTAAARRDYLEKKTGIQFPILGSASALNENAIVGKNIENFLGTSHIPVGIAGPLKMAHARTDCFIPLATTEGALVASVSRGCKAIAGSGGVAVEVEDVGITRAPVFRTRGIAHSRAVKTWIDKNFGTLAGQSEKGSLHLHLKDIYVSFVGRTVYARFRYSSDDAMGMNMATFGTENAIAFIERKTGAVCISVAGNFDVDKKAAWLNFIAGRGKKVWAEITVPKKVVKNVLKTTPEKITEVVYRKCLLGSAMAGSLGFNAHYANVIAAIFAAAGQDLAHVVEGSLGITTAEVLESGDLYFSVYLPALVIGTVGGGTSLPTQSEALSIMGVKGAGKVLKFAGIVAGAVCAGELSLLASQAESSLGRAHRQLGRKGG